MPAETNLVVPTTDSRRRDNPLQVPCLRQNACVFSFFLTGSCEFMFPASIANSLPYSQGGLLMNLFPPLCIVHVNRPVGEIFQVPTTGIESVRWI